MKNALGLFALVMVLVMVGIGTGARADTATIVVGPGDNWVAPPLVPFNPDPASVFAASIGDCTLTRFEVPTQEEVSYGSEGFGNILLGDGYMLMNEALYDGDPAEPDSVILAEHLLQEGLGEDIRGDSVTFDPVGELYVNTALFLQTTEAGSIVQITQFSQTFGGVQVVPEPSTLFIIAIGAAAMILKRCRRRK